MKITKILTLGFFFYTLSLSAIFADEPIRHKLLVDDESRFQLLYLDQEAPENDWVIKAGEKVTPGACDRDMQLIGGNRLLAAQPPTGGFREYDLKTREIVRQVTDARYAGSMTAVRMPDGRTLLGCEQENVRIYILDADGKETKRLDFPQYKGIRLMRRTARDTFLFGANHDRLVEIDIEGKVVKELHIPGANYIYHAVGLPSGGYMIGTGYSGFLAELDAEGKIVKKWGGNPAPEGLRYFLFCQFQILKNGHIVVATWTGHAPEDSYKGQQLVEFDAEGKVVWTWHDPKLAGSVHGVIVLDDLDTEKFNDETKGVLGE